MRWKLLTVGTALALVASTGPAAGTRSTADTAGPKSATDSATITAQAGDRRILAGVHTDAVSVFTDGPASNRKLTLATKADVDDQPGKRFTADSVLFHVEDDVKRTAPGTPGYEFLGPAGSDVWIAPENWSTAPTALWPGFSTESVPAGVLDGDRVRLELTKVAGPGDFHLYTIDVEAVPHQILEVGGPSWVVPINRHIHANWAFSKPGEYRLTFRATATIGGAAKTSTATYVFGVSTLELTRTPTPKIAGKAKVGATLKAKPGAWDAGTRLAFRWLRGSKPIAGATARSYKLVKADKGKKVAVRVTGTKTGYPKVTSTSAPTKKVS